MVVGEGIIEKGALQRGEIEAPGESLGLVCRQLDEAAGQN
jgi:hypothetical protein